MKPPTLGWLCVLLALVGRIAGAEEPSAMPRADRDLARVAIAGELLAWTQPATGTLAVADLATDPPRLVTRFGQPGRQPGEVWGPCGIAFDSARDLLLVADTGNDRIQVFRVVRRSGGQADDLLFLKAVGRTGSEPGEFRDPGSLAIDRHGRVWVADVGNARVQSFDPQLRPLASWRVPSADSNRPSVLSDLAVDHDGERISVVDATHGALRVFDRTGRLVIERRELRATTGARPMAPNTVEWLSETSLLLADGDTGTWSTLDLTSHAHAPLPSAAGWTPAIGRGDVARAENGGLVAIDRAGEHAVIADPSQGTEHRLISLVAARFAP